MRSTSSGPDNLEAQLSHAPVSVEGTVQTTNDVVQNFLVVYHPSTKELVLHIDGRVLGHNTLKRILEKNYSAQDMVVQGGGGVKYIAATRTLVVINFSTEFGPVKSEILNRFAEALKNACGAEKIEIQTIPNIPKKAA